jgi:hypothetical protein
MGKKAKATGVMLWPLASLGSNKGTKIENNAFVRRRQRQHSSKGKTKVTVEENLTAGVAVEEGLTAGVAAEANLTAEVLEAQPASAVRAEVRKWRQGAMTWFLMTCERLSLAVASQGQ